MEVARSNRVIRAKNSSFRWIFSSYLVDIRSRFPDNNWIENRNLPIALGRKNWLFAGSLRAGKSAAAILSMIQVSQTQWSRSLPLSEGYPVSLADSAQQPDQRTAVEPLTA